MNRCSRCNHRGHNRKSIEVCLTFVDYVETQIKPIANRCKPIWKTYDGTILKIKEMESSHIANCIGLFNKKRENVLVQDTEDLTSLVKTYYRETYQNLINELISRKIENIIYLKGSQLVGEYQNG
jgi:hypothetical protein